MQSCGKFHCSVLESHLTVHNELLFSAFHFLVLTLEMRKLNLGDGKWLVQNDPIAALASIVYLSHALSLVKSTGDDPVSPTPIAVNTQYPMSGNTWDSGHWLAFLPKSSTRAVRKAEIIPVTPCPCIPVSPGKKASFSEHSLLEKHMMITCMRAKSL